MNEFFRKTMHDQARAHRTQAHVRATSPRRKRPLVSLSAGTETFSRRGALQNSMDASKNFGEAPTNGLCLHVGAGWHRLTASHAPRDHWWHGLTRAGTSSGAQQASRFFIAAKELAARCSGRYFSLSTMSSNEEQLADLLAAHRIDGTVFGPIHPCMLHLSLTVPGCHCE